MTHDFQWREYARDLRVWLAYDLSLILRKGVSRTGKQHANECAYAGCLYILTVEALTDVD